MGTAFRGPHALGPRNGVLEIQSHSPITRRCLGHSPNLMALFAETPNPRGCRSGLGPITASVCPAGNAEGKFDYVAGEVDALKRAGRVAGEVFALGLSDNGLQGKRIHGLCTGREHRSFDGHGGGSLIWLSTAVAGIRPAAGGEKPASETGAAL